MPYFVKIVNPKPDDNGRPNHVYAKDRKRLAGGDYGYTWTANKNIAKSFYNVQDAEDWLEDSGADGEVIDKLSKTKFI